MQSVCSESQRQSFFGAPVNRSNPDDINPLFLERESETKINKIGIKNKKIIL